MKTPVSQRTHIVAGILKQLLLGADSFAPPAFFAPRIAPNPRPTVPNSPALSVTKSKT